MRTVDGPRYSHPPIGIQNFSGEKDPFLDKPTWYGRTQGFRVPGYRVSGTIVHRKPIALAVGFALIMVRMPGYQDSKT